ncbi:hypothetical protein K8R03_00765 [Candidatus Kaiserbacteria bacterium]|nr:hypothetical protein [Candidatus Kaiserbacteria bacterium]
MGIISTALMGLFVLSGLSGSPAFAMATTTPSVTYIENVGFTVGMTGYNAVPEQTDGDPYTTASGAYSNPEIVAARSQDLADTLPFGTVISVTPPENESPECGASLVDDDIGLRVIADSMHYRKREQIDILLPAEKTVRANGKHVNPAVALGVCEGVVIHVVGMIDIHHMPKNQEELRARVGYLPKADVQSLAVSK